MSPQICHSLPPRMFDRAVNRQPSRGKLITRLAFVALAVSLVFSGFSSVALADNTIRIGSKSFTESVILGEVLTGLASCKQLMGDKGPKVIHRSELGGTQIVWKALLSGEIDAYVEYSGTLQHQILQDYHPKDLNEIVELLRQQNVMCTEPLGFNNSYALGMRKQRASELNIRSISDLREHRKLKFGFSDEFVERSDGWGGLSSRYDLHSSSVRGLDHSLAYRGLAVGSIDVIDLYSTDPEIISYDLAVLEDDQSYFPPYQAIVLYRADLKERFPAAVSAFERLQGKIDNTTMARMNAEARMNHVLETAVANTFLHASVGENLTLPEVTDSYFVRRSKALVINTLQHLMLVGISLTLAILVSVPLGIYSYKRPKFGGYILGIVGIIQTIPSMALLVFMIPLLGLGALPAIVALFLYSLLPIVRGTYTGLCSLAESIHESALALGLPESARLKLIELPLASQQIMAGIKTSAVINVGTATIGALIGAGGLGQPILTGIRLSHVGLILQGAIPAALLALAAQAMFGYIERFVVPKGLQVKKS